MSVGDNVTVFVALVGLAVGLFAALESRRHDRQQQARPILLEPAATFVRAAHAALAALRYVTPPSVSEREKPHRNEELLANVTERQERMKSCRMTVDDVRSARAAVWLVLHPNSLAAGLSWEVVLHLRHALEQAEDFYRDFDQAQENGEEENWRRGAGTCARDSYKETRSQVYNDLDKFCVDVAKRLIKPSWDPRKYAQRPPSMRLSTESNGKPSEP
ncbi:hypothetical protein [Cryobacterium sp. CG_9.6]|uniref:hypothetical protein n=1 Tax=Cryobacterium sp. CG_9.6 TaxID=2760710 RepID=UPI0024761B3E|nr:hypothetical protein [Cryobacterium sp. CG_9.6]MDH6237097.1 hypothetical protein [Cryobacterium sp. CG_9.6]